MTNDEFKALVSTLLGIFWGAVFMLAFPSMVRFSVIVGFLVLAFCYWVLGMYVDRNIS